MKLKPSLATPQLLKTSDALAGTDLHSITTTVIARRRGYVAVACQLADGIDIHALLQQTGDEGAPHIMRVKRAIPAVCCNSARYPLTRS